MVLDEYCISWLLGFYTVPETHKLGNVKAPYILPRVWVLGHTVVVATNGN